MPETYVMVALAVGAVVALGGVIALLSWIPRMYVGVESRQALVVNRASRVEVVFTSTVVIPWVSRAELIDIGRHTVTVKCTGPQGLVCGDDVRVDIEAVFVVAIGRTAEDILKVASTVGCARAGDPATLKGLFHAKFHMGLAQVVRRHDFVELLDDRVAIADEVFAEIGADLAGYVLHEVSLARLEQTPRAALDPDNILDAKGLRKIVTIASEEKIRRHEVEQAIIDLERAKAEGLASFRQATGCELTEEELGARVDARVAAMIQPAVARAVREALAAPAAAD
jgi:uncharacterized membrane protein YqiK